MDNGNNLMFQTRHLFFINKWKATWLHDYYLFLKKSDRNVNKERHIEKQEQIEIEHIFIKKTTFWKPVSPNGTVITMVSWKAGSRQGRPAQESITAKFRICGRTWCPKGAFLKIPKTEKGTPKQTFYKRSALGPSKNGPHPGAVWKKHETSMKIDRKMIDRGMRKSSLARACVRISHFRRFSKSMNIYGKVGPQSHPKSFTTGRSGDQGRLIDHLYWFWAVSKKLVFLCRLGVSNNW